MDRTSLLCLTRRLCGYSGPSGPGTLSGCQALSPAARTSGGGDRSSGCTSTGHRQGRLGDRGAERGVRYRPTTREGGPRHAAQGRRLNRWCVRRPVSPGERYLRFCSAQPHRARASRRPGTRGGLRLRATERQRRGPAPATRPRTAAATGRHTWPATTAHCLLLGA
jgi:hypothetical protein